MHNFLCSDKDSTIADGYLADETSRWCGVWLQGSSCTHPGGGEGRIVCRVALSSSDPLGESMN